MTFAVDTTRDLMSEPTSTPHSKEQFEAPQTVPKASPTGE